MNPDKCIEIQRGPERSLFFISIESVVFHIVCEGFDGRVVQQFPKGNIVDGPGDGFLQRDDPAAGGTVIFRDGGRRKADAKSRVGQLSESLRMGFLKRKI